MAPPDLKLLTREILLGLWKIHILHHAAEHPVVGQWVLTELRRHGYDISPGTLYPLLRRMERNGWLRSKAEQGGGARSRRYYHLTRSGRAVLEILREAVRELHHEVIADAGSTASVRRTASGAWRKTKRATFDARRPVASPARRTGSKR